MKDKDQLLLEAAYDSMRKPKIEHPLAKFAAYMLQCGAPKANLVPNESSMWYQIDPISDVKLLNATLLALNNLKLLPSVQRTLRRGLKEIAAMAPGMKQEDPNAPYQDSFEKEEGGEEEGSEYNMAIMNLSGSFDGTEVYSMIGNAIGIQGMIDPEPEGSGYEMHGEVAKLFFHLVQE